MRCSQGLYPGSPHVFGAGISLMTWGSFLLIIQENMVKITAQAGVKMVCNQEDKADFSGARKKKSWPRVWIQGLVQSHLENPLLAGLCTCSMSLYFHISLHKWSKCVQGAYFSIPGICSRIALEISRSPETNIKKHACQSISQIVTFKTIYFYWWQKQQSLPKVSVESLLSAAHTSLRLELCSCSCASVFMHLSCAFRS